MLQQTPYLLCTRPLTYFGNYQQLEEELDRAEEFFDADQFSEQLGFISDAHPIQPFEQKIGLFIHWFNN